MAKQRKGYYFGGETTTSGKPFTEGSLRFIKKNARKLPAKSIANILHRSVQSVRSQAKKLGVNLTA
jgi:hypothetical protein